MKRIMALGVFGALLLAVPLSADETSVLKTQKEKLSYTVGVELSTNLKRQGVEMEAESLFKGFRDGFLGEKLLLSDEDLHKQISLFHSEIRRKQNEIRRKQAEIKQKQKQKQEQMQTQGNP